MAHPDLAVGVVAVGEHEHDLPPGERLQLVEPSLLRWYEKRHVAEGETARRPLNSRYHHELSWARCTPDLEVYAPGAANDSLSRVCQAKNVGHRMMHRWQDGPPDWVVCQVNWECFVLGIGRGDVVASLGGTPPEVYTLWRDQQMIDDLRAIGEQFMRHVRERTEPRTTHHEDWARYLANRAKSRGFIVPLESVDGSLIDEWKASTLALKSAEKRADLAKNRVRRFLADSNADGMDTGTGVATWKPDKNGNRALRAPKTWGGEEK